MAAKQDIRADTNDRSAVGAEAPPNDWAPAPSTSLFSVGRLLAVAGLTLRHGVRMNVWLLVPAAVFVLIVADLTSPRFDPVFERVPRTVEISLSAMIAVGILISIFLSTFTLPKEIETHTIYTVLTKPVSRLELIAGKAVGLSMLLAVCLGPMALVSWGYIHVRARQVRALAEAEYAERKATAPFPADLGALEHMRDRGPLTARKFINPAGRPEVRTLVPEPPWKWILGRSGEVLNWEFPEPAKPEIIGRGTTIRLFVKYRKLEGAGQEAPKLRVLIRYDLKVLRSLDPEQRQVLRNTVTRELDSDGRLEVGLTTLLQGPNRKGLDYIGHGPLNIAVVCDSEGVILGSTKD
ncbi:MAG: ABC transporter permease subunit, partial [Planctomycetia bacterium]|nr:ABC transporter permease subunit [Planctomycetia bacterium]